MRVVQIAHDGAIELCWMWLPTFIGNNYGLQKEIGEAWKRQFPSGVRGDEDGLEAMHQFTIAWLQQRLNIPGLEDYLRAIENVQDGHDVESGQERG
jgi:hypothetical protein